MDHRKVPFTAVDRVLLTAILCLSGFLLVEAFGMADDWWQYHSRPGAQVYQQYVGKEGDDANPPETVINYLLYLPPQYTAKQKWPLVVFLHGSGERGQDLELVRRTGLPEQIEQGERPGCVLVSPQCPASSRWNPKVVVTLIEHVCRSLPIDRDRVYLSGFSMGGFGTWATACYDPSRFAAIAPLAGGGDVSEAERLANLPIWAFHGAEDDVVSLSASEKMVEAVRTCGGNVKLTVYPECDHEMCCEKTYRDPRLLEWLLAQRRSPARKQAAPAINH
jgi:predicted peptidase